MAEAKIKITLNIAQHPIELYTSQEHEHYYRDAEVMINDHFFTAAKQWSYTDQKDLLTKILVDRVVKLIAVKERLDAYEEDLIPKMTTLKEITDQIPT